MIDFSKCYVNQYIKVTNPAGLIWYGRITHLMTRYTGEVDGIAYTKIPIIPISKSVGIHYMASIFEESNLIVEFYDYDEVQFNLIADRF